MGLWPAGSDSTLGDMGEGGQLSCLRSDLLSDILEALLEPLLEDLLEALLPGLLVGLLLGLLLCDNHGACSNASASSSSWIEDGEGSTVGDREGGRLERAFLSLPFLCDSWKLS